MGKKRQHMNDLSTETELSIDHYLDTQGLICPEPVMLLHKSIRNANGGDLIEVLATDPATTRDIPNFCRHLGHQLVAQQILDKNNQETSADTVNHYRYVIQKKQS